MKLSTQCLLDASYFLDIARAYPHIAWDSDGKEEVTTHKRASRIDCRRVLDIFMIARADNEYRSFFNSIVERVLKGPGESSKAPSSRGGPTPFGYDPALSEMFRDGYKPFPDNSEDIDDTKHDIAVFMQYLVASAMSELIEDCGRRRDEASDLSESAGSIPLKLTPDMMRQLEDPANPKAIPLESGSHWINAAAGSEPEVGRSMILSGRKGHLLSDCKVEWQSDGEVRLSTTDRSAGRLAGVDRFVLVFPGGLVCRPLPGSTFHLAVFRCPDQYRGKGPVGMFVHDSKIPQD